MPVHHFVRFRPPPGDGQGVRQMTIGPNRFSADVGWVLLERASAVSLKFLYHPDHKARAAFSYAFRVESVEYPEQSPHWVVSPQKPEGVPYEACLSPVVGNEFQGFAYAGHVFTHEAGWLRVTREQAEFLDVTRAMLGNVGAPSAFLTRLAYQPPAAGPTIGGASHTGATIPPRQPAPVPAPAPRSRLSATIELGPPPDGDPEADVGSDEDVEVEPGADVGAGDGSDDAQLPLEDQILAALQSVPLATSEIARALGMSQGSGHFRKTVQTLMERKLIEFTIPDKPASRFQKYRLSSAPAADTRAELTAEISAAAVGDPPEATAADGSLSERAAASSANAGDELPPQPLPDHPRNP